MIFYLNCLITLKLFVFDLLGFKICLKDGRFFEIMATTKYLSYVEIFLISLDGFLEL